MTRMKTLFGLMTLAALAVVLPACGSTSPSDATVVTEDLIAGFGATIATGDFVTVAYVGSFTNGSVFETSNSFPFRFGTGAVIKGWDQGMVGMKIGGKRRLTIPPDLAYGKAGNTTIPGNSTLKFDITLLAIAGK